MSEFREYDLLEYPVDEGRVLIEAAAGSGKTYTIQYLFLRLLLERRELEPADILVVTFTEAATEELKERIRGILATAVKRLKEENGPGDEPRGDLDRILERALEGAVSREKILERLELARRTFDETVIATIHGFCSRVLSEYTFEAGIRSRVELVKNSRRFCRLVAEDYWRRRFYGDFLDPGEKRLVAAAGVEIDHLVALAEELERKPSLAILPETASGATWSADLKNRLAEMARQVSAWAPLAGSALKILRSARPEIREEMFADKPLNARNWKEADFESRADQVEGLLAAAALNLPEMDPELEKFSRSYLVKKTKKKCRTPEHLFFELCEELYRLAEDFVSCLQQVAALVQRDFADFALGPEGFAAVKGELRCQGYGDFLTELRRVLAEPRGELVIEKIRQRFRVAMIDEFQDTDPVQYEIFNRLFVAPGILFYRIGDPKQSIYAFRGADIFAYLAASRESGQTRATLDRNFRSNPELLAAVNRIFGVPAPFFYPEIEYRPARAGNPPGTRLLLSGQPVPAFEFWCLAAAGKRSLNSFTASWRLVRAAVAYCARLLAEGELREGEEDYSRKLKASDIALLTRTNQQSALFWRACHARGLPAVLAAAGNLWESDEARELFLFLQAVVTPESDPALSTALATSLLRRKPAWLDAVRAAADSGRELEAPAGLEYLAWRLAFTRAKVSWKQRGILAMLAEFPDFSDAEKNPAPGFSPALCLAAGFRGERALANFFHLQEVLHEAERELQLGPEALLNWLHEHLAGMARDEKEYELRLESEEEAIRILTVHRSKGLEFPVVLAPFLWSGSFARGKNQLLVFHREDDAGDYVATLDLSSDPAEEYLRRLRNENLAEDLRLAYVALTRAQSALRMAWALTSNSAKSALMYLRRPPADEEQRKNFVEDDRLKAKLEVIDGEGARIWETDENIARVDLAGRSLFGNDGEADPAAAGGVAAAPVGPARVFDRSLPPASGCISFSRLTSAVHDDWQAAGFGEKALAAIDPGSREPETEAMGGFPASEMPEPLTEPSLLVDLPGGAATGNALHEIFEKLDFTLFADLGSGIYGDVDGSPAAVGEVRDLIAGTLAAYGLLPETGAARLIDAIVELVVAVLRLPLPATGLKPGALYLADPTLELAREMEFWLPLAERFVPDEISGWGENTLAPDWRLELPDRLPGRGYLNGFIDLVFAASGRYFLLDWKTNNLGPDCSAYNPEALAADMRVHHYELQYHLYLVALHRLLKQRLADYDYERDFGGVYYLYLRGINRRDASTGVYFHRPGRRAVEELEKVICGEVL